MIDITRAVAESGARAELWSSDSARRCVDVLARVNDCRVNWDGDAGEEWADLVRDHHRILILSTRGPLAFAEGRVDTGPHDGLDAIETVRVTSFDDPVLRCDAVVLEAFFKDPVAVSCVDADGFSVTDLWFATM
jgi:hypothetical protein